MQNEKLLKVYSLKDFRNWLLKNHNKENKIGLIIHRKHTGKNSPKPIELMKEAICFGWIDTTLKRLDEDKYIKNFSRRNKNSKWSKNTLSYGKFLIKEKRMTPSGLIFYKEGLKKLPYDKGLSKNPKIPFDLKKEIEKDKKIQSSFKKLAPSYKKMYFRWIIRAKKQDTRKKRIENVIAMIREGKKSLI
jgi:uncharacterized protein YdeI (YjbR/CyaY-like superfamily)